MAKSNARQLFADRETRVVHTFNGNPEKSRVDPTYAKDSQIHNMLLKFARGEISPRQPFYADVSHFSDFREMQDRVLTLRQEFDKLPSPVRNLCQNDPGNLLNVIQDPKNKDFLVEYGVFKQLKQEVPKETPVAGSGVQPQPAPKEHDAKTQSVDKKN